MAASSTGLRLVHSSAGDVPGDGALCRAFLAGDERAFGELVRRHQELLLRVLRRYASSPDETRDLVQRAFLQAFQAARRALPRLAKEGDVPFKPWLLRIAINLGKNHLRDTSRWTTVPVDAAEGRRAEGGAQEALERAEQEAAVRRAVLLLPRRQRDVFTLRIDGGLPFAEVAQALGITEGNAKTHFHHAVKRLKEETRKS
ncbi:MAG: sigma-70 family RNA polymerase sigma factor [Myxococcota bacterium]